MQDFFLHLRPKLLIILILLTVILYEDSILALLKFLLVLKI